MTADPEVREKIFASGHRTRASVKVTFLMRLATPRPLKAGLTIRPDVVT